VATSFFGQGQRFLEVSIDEPEWRCELCVEREEDDAIPGYTAKLGQATLPVAPVVHCQYSERRGKCVIGKR
jgi:hypothetical protein